MADVKIDNQSGRAFIATIALFVDEEPQQEFLGIKIQCPEGTFEQISPRQLAAIGWEAR